MAAECGIPQVDFLADTLKPGCPASTGGGAVADCYPVSQFEGLDREQEKACTGNTSLKYWVDIDCSLQSPKTWAPCIPLHFHCSRLLPSHPA